MMSTYPVSDAGIYIGVFTFSLSKTLRGQYCH